MHRAIALATLITLVVGSAIAADSPVITDHKRLKRAYSLAKVAPQAVEVCATDDPSRAEAFAGAWQAWQARTPGRAHINDGPGVDVAAARFVTEFRAKSPGERKPVCDNFLRTLNETVDACAPPAPLIIASIPDRADLRTALAGYTASEDHEAVTSTVPATHYRTYAALFVDVDDTGAVRKTSFQHSTGNRMVDKALAKWVRGIVMAPEDCEFARIRQAVLPIDLRGDITPGTAWEQK